jgi:hypothetical protein
VKKTIRKREEGQENGEGRERRTYISTTQRWVFLPQIHFKSREEINILSRYIYFVNREIVRERRREEDEEEEEREEGRGRLGERKRKTRRGRRGERKRKKRRKGRERGRRRRREGRARDRSARRGMGDGREDTKGTRAPMVPEIVEYKSTSMVPVANAALAIELMVSPSDV